MNPGRTSGPGLAYPGRDLQDKDWPPPSSNEGSVDWQSGQFGIDGLRDIVRQNSRAAAREVDLVRGASARVSLVQNLLLARPQREARPAADQPSPDLDMPGDPDAGDAPPSPPSPAEGSGSADARRPGGVARLREGPLADLFRATDARPGKA